MTGLLPPDHPKAPKYWANETSGILAPAIERYLRNPRDVTLRDIAIIRAYIRQWVESPVWLRPGTGWREIVKLNELRASARAISTVADLRKWFAAAVREGIDPL